MKCGREAEKAEKAAEAAEAVSTLRIREAWEAEVRERRPWATHLGKEREETKEEGEEEAGVSLKTDRQQVAPEAEVMRAGEVVEVVEAGGKASTKTAGEAEAEGEAEAKEGEERLVQAG